MKSLTKWIAGAMLACTILTSVGATAASAEERDSKPAPSADRWWTMNCYEGNGTLHGPHGYVRFNVSCDGTFRFGIEWRTADDAEGALDAIVTSQRSAARETAGAVTESTAKWWHLNFDCTSGTVGTIYNAAGDMLGEFGCYGVSFKYMT